MPLPNSRIKRVHSFQELVSTPFADGVNALCWPRTLPGDFGEVVALLGAARGSAAAKPMADRQETEDGGNITLDEARLRGLKLSAAGRVAVDVMLEDLRLLRDLGRDPVLNCIDGYPRDEDAGPVPTDVFSFHADSAPVEADTWLCTYHGPASEGLRNDEALRKVDVPATRAELLKLFGGADDDSFREFLKENCYDLHYAPVPSAQPFSFGLFNLWRIAIEHPGNRPGPPQVSGFEFQVSASPPCIHRAPETLPGQPPRLLLIA